LLMLPFTVKAMEKPIVLLTFDSVSGDTVKDQSGNGNDGKLQNNPKAIDGKSGKAFEFAESRIMVTASDTFTTEIFKDGIFTVVLWIKAKRSGNEWQQIFRAGPDPNDTIFLNNNGTLSWRGMVKGAWAGGMCETAANAVPADTWTHVAVVGDAKNFRDYIDGKLAKESNFQETMGNNKEYMIGGYSGGESYNGAVDEFAVFKASLKEAEINSIMSKGVLGATAVDSTSKLATRWGSLKLNP
ncbi:MAG: LamG protein, partial [Candidatus Poribacteria bacterium]|nr:LamG protein [Candidatus Poribacteria bacterium]